MLRLYFDPVSTTSRPVWLFIQHQNIDIELQVINLMAGEQHSPEFLAMNPNHGVPVLRHDDFILTESSAIMKYLADMFDSPAYPKDLKARARVNEAMDWFNTGFYHHFAYGLVYTQVLDAYRWEDPVQQQVALAKATPRAEEKLGILDRKLKDGGPYICGADITLADYFGAVLVGTGELIGFDLSPYPHVAAWMNRMKAIPAWAGTHEAFGYWCAQTAAVR